MPRNSLPDESDQRHVHERGGASGLAGHLQEDVRLVRGLAHHQAERFLQPTIVFSAKSNILFFKQMKTLSILLLNAPEQILNFLSSKVLSISINCCHLVTCKLHL